MTNSARSTTGGNGRGSGGRFGAGNQFGRGNPHAAQVARLRSAMLTAVSDADIAAIMRKLVEMAMGGDVQAAKLLLDRTLGKPSVSESEGMADGQSEQLGPVTKKNVKEHRAIRLARLAEEVQGAV